MRLILFFSLFFIFSFAGEEIKISLKEVPNKIMIEVQGVIPKATIISANLEKEKNSTLYEVQGRFPDGRSVEVDIFDNGKIEEVEIEFPEYMVPKAVLIAIEKKYKGFIPTYIEASHSKSMKVIQYEFEGTYNNKKIDLEVSADGRKIKEGDK